MSSLRNAVKRKTHKERAQPVRRKKLGLLEKKKDYRLRADDYQRKQKQLAKLQLKASMKNPDEFYFGMVNKKTDDGIHRNGPTHQSDDVKKLVRTQNMSYLRMHDAIEASNLSKLKSSLHFIGDNTIQNRHTIFVDDEEELANFKKAEYFETSEEFKDRSFNRPTKAMLSSGKVLVVGDKQDLKEALKARDQSYSNLEQRLERKEKIVNALDHMQLHKNLSTKGRRKKVKDAINGSPAVYKWKQERKR